MGVKKYQARGRVFWEVDEWLPLPDGRRHRYRQRKIPTKEAAKALIAKARIDAFEGRFFDRAEPDPDCTVSEAWSAYKKVSERDVDSWKTDKGRAAHLVRHLGQRGATSLTLADVDAYRNRRLGENTRRGRPPALSTLDKEVELLNRFLNYAVRCGRLKTNPVAGTKSLVKVHENARKVVVQDEVFDKILAPATELIRPHLLLLRDTAMRKGDVLQLRHDQVDLKRGVIDLGPMDTKEEANRLVPLTPRCIEAIKEAPRHISSPYVFVNPRTGKPWADLRSPFKRACKDAGVKQGMDDGIILHDLRRTSITEFRKAGVPESVVMRISGHKTRSVFERYNIVDEEDLHRAVRDLVRHRGQELDKVSKAPRKAKNPTG